LDLILHPGLHKTGTSSLQTFFKKNEMLFRKKGIIYPKNGCTGIQHASIPCSVMEDKLNLNIHRADLKSLINKLQNELKASTAQNCFISSEIFSELSSEKLYLVLENLSELFKSTSIFLTTRNIEMASLSGLKHRLRKNSENPKLYKDVIKRPNLVFKRICRSSKEKILMWEDISDSFKFKFQKVSMDDAGNNDLCLYYLSKMPFKGNLIDVNSNIEGLEIGIHQNRSDKYQALSYLICFLSAYCGETNFPKKFYLDKVDHFLKNIYSKNNLLKVNEKISSKLMINYLKVTDKNFQKDSFIFDQISQIFSFKEKEINMIKEIIYKFFS